MNQEEKQFLKNLYRDGKLSFEKDYFKSLLNLSAGALALSITIAQIAFNSVIVCRWLLITSWLFLGLAALSVLFYFILAQYEFKKRIEDIENESNVPAQNEKELDVLEKHTNTKLEGKKLKAAWILKEESVKRRLYDKLGFISSAAFFTGIILLGVFTYFNLLSN